MTLKFVRIHKVWSIYRRNLYLLNNSYVGASTNVVVFSVLGTGVTTYSVHPGIIASELNRNVRGTWWEKIFSFIAPLFSMSRLPVKEGIQTTLYCCLEPTLSNESGLYYR